MTKVITFNVRGIRDSAKRMLIFNYLKKFKADLVLLQERHVLNEDYELWKNNWGTGDIFINPYNERSAGQVILLSKKYKILSHEIIVPGRCQNLILSMNEYGQRSNNIL